MSCLVDFPTISDTWAAQNRRLESSGAGHTATRNVFWNSRGAKSGATIRSWRSPVTSEVAGSTFVRFSTNSATVSSRFVRSGTKPGVMPGIEKNGSVANPVGVTVLSRVAAQVAMLYLAVRLSGSDGWIDVTRDVDPALAALVALGVIATFPIAALPVSRRAIGRSVTPALRSSASGLRALTAAPTRMAQLVVGSVLAPLASAGAMVAADRMFGGTLDPPSIALVVLAVVLVAAFVPVPGGAGVVEAGIVGGFMLLGEHAAVAVPAVFAFRFATFWVPVAAGCASTRWLRGHDQLLR